MLISPCMCCTKKQRIVRYFVMLQEDQFIFDVFSVDLYVFDTIDVR